MWGDGVNLGVQVLPWTQIHAVTDNSGSADSECVPVLHAGSFLWREGLVLHAGVSVDTHWSLQQEWEVAP